MNLLDREPGAVVGSLEDLLGVALALEQEAVRRYGQLSALMDSRGELSCAATFRMLMEEELNHVAAVGTVSTTLLGRVPDAGAFVWMLPAEIAASWDELADRTDLSPYRALSLAVLNEERAFAFYSYIMSATSDITVRNEAKVLALEELGHAAKLRRERRKAWRAQAPDTAKAAMNFNDVGDLTVVAGAMAGKAIVSLRSAADALSGMGRLDDAAALTRISDNLSSLTTGSEGDTVQIDPRIGRERILRSALLTLEQMSEVFSDIAERAQDEAVLLEAQRIFGIAVGHAVRLAELVSGERSQ